MGTWYNDAPEEFKAWMQTRFNAHDAPPTEGKLIKLQTAWECGYVKGKGVLDES